MREGFLTLKIIVSRQYRCFMKFGRGLVFNEIYCIDKFNSYNVDRPLCSEDISS